jgi:hypothetical protein
MSPLTFDVGKLPHNTYALNRDATLWMYGPTLSAFATWLDIEQQLVQSNAGLIVDDKASPPML